MVRKRFSWNIINLAVFEAAGTNRRVRMKRRIIAIVLATGMLCGCSTSADTVKEE